MNKISHSLTFSHGCAAQLATVSQTSFNFGLEIISSIGQQGSRTPLKSRYRLLFQGSCCLVLNLSLCISLGGNSAWLWGVSVSVLSKSGALWRRREKKASKLSIYGENKQKSTKKTRACQTAWFVFSVGSFGVGGWGWGERRGLVVVATLLLGEERGWHYCRTLAMEADGEGRGRLNMPCGRTGLLLSLVSLWFKKTLRKK